MMCETGLSTTGQTQRNGTYIPETAPSLPLYTCSNDHPGTTYYIHTHTHTHTHSGMLPVLSIIACLHCRVAYSQHGGMEMTHTHTHTHTDTHTPACYLCCAVVFPG